MWSLGPLRLSVLLTAAVVPQFAAADDFYAGKTVNFIVGTDISGGFSIYARLIAKYLPRYISGKPTIVVKNMPGAGGVTAANYLYRDAPSDGTTFAALTPNAISAKVIDDFAQSQFEPVKFKYLAGAERGTRLCMTFHTSKVASFLDAQKLKVVMGVTSAGSPTTQYAAFHKHALGAQFDIVSGYRGPADIFLAMERGEIDGTCGLDWSALKAQQPEWLRGKKLNLLVQDNMEPDPELSALGVPQPWPFIKGEIDRRAVELMIGFQQAFGKAYVAPPGASEDRVQVLREAFGGALRDKGLLDEAEKIGIEITSQTGDQIARVVSDLYNAPKPVTERLKQIVVP